MPHFYMSAINKGERGYSNRVPRKNTMSARLNRVKRRGHAKKKRAEALRTFAKHRKRGAGGKFIKRSSIVAAARRGQRRGAAMRRRNSGVIRVPVRRLRRGGPTNVRELGSLRDMFSDVKDELEKLRSAVRRGKRRGAALKGTRPNRGKKMAKLRGAAKRRFLRKMAKGKAKARRRGRGRRNVSHRRRLRRARRNPATRRQRRMTIPQADGMGGSRRRRRRRRGGGTVKRRVAFRRRRGARKYRVLSRKIRRISGRRRGGVRSHGKRRGGRRVTPASVRLSGLKLQRRAIFPGVSAEARHYMRVHGLTRINRGGGVSMKQELKLIPTLLKQGSVAAVGFFGLGALGKVGGEWLLGNVDFLAQRSSSPWLRAAVKGVTSVAGTSVLYVGSRMFPSTRKWSGLLAIGGAIGALANVASEGTVKVDGVEKSLGDVMRAPVGSTLLPNMNLGPVDKRLGSGNYADRANFQGGNYTDPSNFKGLMGSHDEIRKDAIRRRMDELAGRDAGGSRDGSM